MIRADHQERAGVGALGDDPVGVLDRGGEGLLAEDGAATGREARAACWSGGLQTATTSTSASASRSSTPVEERAPKRSAIAAARPLPPSLTCTSRKSPEVRASVGACNAATPGPAPMMPTPQVMSLLRATSARKKLKFETNEL